MKMKMIFSEIFSKISNGIFIGCIGCILMCWGLYEHNDIMMFVGIAILAIGFILAVTNEERRIREFDSLKASNEKLKKRLKDRKQELEKLQDAVLDLTQNMEQVTSELKLKNETIERFRKIKVSMLKKQQSVGG